MMSGQATFTTCSAITGCEFAALGLFGDARRMRIPKQPTVIIRHCPDYDTANIQKLFREGLTTLGLKPTGRTLIKPNIVAAGPLFPHAHTRPEVAEGLIRALQELADHALSEIAVGERCSATAHLGVGGK